jgi:CheY-like chemotaxis protein
LKNGPAADNPASDWSVLFEEWHRDAHSGPFLHAMAWRPVCSTGSRVPKMRMKTAASTCQVLVVEDDANALSGYLEFLGAAGFEPTGVSTGAEALPIALRNPPAAIVTDITLPGGMSGFELAAALHCDVRTRAVPVIGLTAHWTPDVRARALDVSMQAILLKPCVPSHLVAELERVLGRAKSLDAVSTRRAVKIASLPSDTQAVPIQQATAERR